MEGQVIIQGKSISSTELVSKLVKDLEQLLRETLQLDNQPLPQQTRELLKKAANLAQGKVEYPEPGQWQPEDFQLAAAELSDRLYIALNLKITSLSQELQAETQKVIEKALDFLERAALAEPPACFSLEKQGEPFRIDYHQAAKGWPDEGGDRQNNLSCLCSQGRSKSQGSCLN